MPWLLAAVFSLLIAGSPAFAAIWPEVWREHKRVKVEPVVVADRPLWLEFEGEEAEKAVYDGPAGKFTATAWRLKDSTAALAWYQAIRPANAVPVRGALLASTTPGSQLVAHQNHVLLFEGWRPLDREMAALYQALSGAMRSGGGLPMLPSFIPDEGKVRNSERYLLGITSLERFEPRIPPVLAGFEDGAEAQYVKYRTSAGEVAVTVFHYPTPQIAKKRLTAFEARQGWAVRRDGALVAVAPEIDNPQAILPVLEKVKWGVQGMWNQATKPPPMPNVAGMLVAIFELTGLLLAACVAGGLLFAWLWIYQRRKDARETGNESPILFLRIEDR
jgi:hypothetical protein